MKTLRILLLIPCMAYAGDQGLTRINRPSLHVAHELGKMRLYHNGTSFIAKQNGIKTEVGSESLDSALRHVNATNLNAFLKVGRIQVTKTDDGSLMLRHYVHGKGGGPVLASVGYWSVKVLCWAGIVTAGTVAVAVPVTAGVALVGGGVAAGTAGGLAVGGAKLGMSMVAGSAMAASAPVSGVVVAASSVGVVVSGMTATTAGASAASLGSAALITGTAGTSLGVAGSIEALAMAAFIGGMAVPCP